ncbi:glycerol-3-phosphate acyltransferase [Clostridia bacterium]|nr:glycerol-3-phosphate acyltransferase [Clostridia bacterium]
MRVIGWIVVAAASYIVGGLSTGLWISSRLQGLDVRQFGSHSSGATNVLRKLGRGPGLLTFGGDVLKGVVTALVGFLLAGRACACLCGFLAVVGNIWPATAQFKGGKGVSTAAGVFLVVAPLPALIAIAAAFACIYLTRYVSLSSLLGIALYFVVVGVPGLFRGQVWLFLFALGIAGVVSYAHRENISRLLNNRENKIDLELLTGKRKA